MDFERSLVKRIQKSLDFVEEHIHEEIIIEEVAKVAFMSQASFYVIFSKMFGSTIKEYIIKRRLTMSAYELVYSNHSILEVALNANYNSYEAFSRKFKKIFGDSPTGFRKKGIYIELFPAISLINGPIRTLDGGTMMSLTRSMNQNRVDATLKNHIKGYLIDVDIDKFMSINDDYGHDIGDKVLLEVPTRIERVLRAQKIDSTIVRIAGDEFAIVINDIPKGLIKLLADEIIKSMEPIFDFGDVTLPVTVSLGIAQYDTDGIESVKESVLEALIDAKNSGRNTYKFY